MTSPEGVTTYNFPLPDSHYAGWIPCINGHLSFSLFGDDPQFSSANVRDAKKGNGHRRIFVAERRYCQDFLVPSRFQAVFPARRRVQSDFYLQAQTEFAAHPVDRTGTKIEPFPDEVGQLSGTISIIIPAEDKAIERSRVDIYRRIRKLAEKTHQSAHRQYEPFQDVFDAFPKRIGDHRDDGGVVFQFDFVAYRTGEVRIAPVDSSFPLSEYEGDDSADRSDFIQTQAAQAYYFIKDAAHRHYHHEKKKDNILPLVEASRSDDEGWRRETMWSLVRAILNERRKTTIEQFTQATGILAYAESFQDHLGRHVRTGPSFDTFEPIGVTSEYDLTHMKGSLHSRRDELKWLT